ncbi:hypothetical protein Cgig2_032885 [Carnegiea gigantea]|uniref:Uncharacterized protein n=1 Tax=Carnegiea gigantea TaxID=171969 RepID=A0A9Q1GSX9_9CARY|nr:hypothetical protein Cgig2_033063 [Carnegiea gigantea]KAJ8429892.1 hypothetical protein Cgig2_032885 [Carnegiea gigantea]
MAQKVFCFLNNDEVESIHRANVPSLVPRPQCPFEGSIREDFQVDKNAPGVFGKAILDKVSHSPFDRLPSLKGDFDSLYAAILQSVINVLLQRARLKGLIRQACDFQDYNRATLVKHPLKNMIVIAWRLNWRHEELLKELQLLDDQKKDLSCQVVVGKHLLQEDQIDIFDATKVMDVATTTSLEKTEAYIKESLEDLKNF